MGGQIYIKSNIWSLDLVTKGKQTTIKTKLYAIEFGRQVGDKVLLKLFRKIKSIMTELTEQNYPNFIRQP